MRSGQRPCSPWSEAIWPPPPSRWNARWRWSAAPGLPSITWPSWTGPGSGRQAAAWTRPSPRCPRRVRRSKATTPFCSPGPTSSKPALRLGLGDQNGAQRVTEQLPGDRQMVMSAIIALAAGNPEEAAKALSDAPAEGTTIRTDLELRLLRANIAVSQSSTRGTGPGPAGSGRSGAARFRPDRSGHSSAAGRARDLQPRPLSQDQAAVAADHAPASKRAGAPRPLPGRASFLTR